MHGQTPCLWYRTSHFPSAGFHQAAFTGSDTIPNTWGVDESQVIVESMFKGMNVVYTTSAHVGARQNIHRIPNLLTKCVRVL